MAGFGTVYTIVEKIEITVSIFLQYGEWPGLNATDVNHAPWIGPGIRPIVQTLMHRLMQSTYLSFRD